jgi:hypothetical protein
MKKRVAAALLWFYATWYAWSMLASFVGAPDLFGPVVGAAVAALIAGDPMHRIWSRVEATPKTETVPAGARQLA